MCPQVYSHSQLGDTFLLCREEESTKYIEMYESAITFILILFCEVADSIREATSFSPLGPANSPLCNALQILLIWLASHLEVVG